MPPVGTPHPADVVGLRLRGVAKGQESWRDGARREVGLVFRQRLNAAQHAVPARRVSATTHARTSATTVKVARPPEPGAGPFGASSMGASNEERVAALPAAACLPCSSERRKLIWTTRVVVGRQAAAAVLERRWHARGGETTAGRVRGVPQMGRAQGCVGVQTGARAIERGASGKGELLARRVCVRCVCAPHLGPRAPLERT